MNRIVSNVLRLASVERVDYNTGKVYTKWLDQAGTDGPIVPIPHPYSGLNGEGIYVGVSKGSVLVLSMLANEEYLPVAVWTVAGNYGDITALPEADYDSVGVPYLDSGDIILQGSGGGTVKLAGNGDLEIINAFGEGIYYSGTDNDSVRCAISTGAPTQYTISNLGICARGLIRRDIRVEEGEDDFVDFLTDTSSEQALEEVGWDITKKPSYITRDPTNIGAGQTSEKRFRNPPMVEERKIIFEYGGSWDVGNFGTELRRMENSEIPLADTTDRRQRRSNVLSLSQTHPNELIEVISGTLVDIFGNTLGINKNILPSPEGTSANELLKSIFEINRHGVAFHAEINTKKGYAYRETKNLTTRKPALIEGNGDPDPMLSANNARDRSRWSMRIDKEGLTTINIPSTSETGNIPLLTRQETSSVLDVDTDGTIKGQREDSAGLYRNDKNQDIFHDQFGPGGISISGQLIDNRLQGNHTSWIEDNNGNKQQKAFSKYVEAGTAFHDITKTAQALIEEDINWNASDIFDPPIITPGLPAISSGINSNIPKAQSSVATRNQQTGLVEDQPNAGGRSAQINMDGSLETSIGANTIDRVSWVMDTAGAIVARIGRDRQGRSAIIQADGTVALEIGGFDFVGESSTDEVDTRFVGRGESRTVTLPGDPKMYKSGKLVIRIKRANPTQTGPDPEDNLLIIDDTGMTLVAAGRLNLVSGLDMTLKSNSRITFEAPVVQNYIDNPKFVLRSGRIIP